MRRIAVVKRGDLGDLLLTLPALRALRDALPEATIDLLGSRAAREVLRDLNLVDRVLPLP
ncbi:MAG: glycosyltransferase family 9 protein, partial [Chloroflexi bacterium]|nr:glycosyltransferase family 9 protein [Chloroflexota bacterium]